MCGFACDAFFITVDGMKGVDHIALQRPLVSALITWLVASIFVYFAARFVTDRSSFIAALLSVLIGSVLAALVAIGISALEWPAMVGTILGLAAYALVIAIFYRTDWIKGAIIGLVAGVLYVVVTYLVGLVF